MSNFYLQPYPSGSKVYFDYDPFPLPKFNFDRKIIEQDTSASSTSPSRRILWDLGGALSRSKIEISLPYMTQTTLNTIKAIWDASPPAQLYYYDAHLATKYLCKWASGNSFDPVPIAGSEFYTCKITLIPQQIV